MIGKVLGLIRKWGVDNDLYKCSNAVRQLDKLEEEFNELKEALLKDDQAEVVDAIGDMVVVLTHIAKFRGVSIEECIYTAYGVISKRKLKCIDGLLVKEENWPENKGGSSE